MVITKNTVFGCAALVFMNGCFAPGLPDGWECNDDDYPCKQGEVCRSIGIGDDANPRCWTVCQTNADCAHRSDSKITCRDGVCQTADTECVRASDCRIPDACKVLEGATCNNGQCVYQPKQCTTPPADECLESGTIFRDYADVGTCAAADSECQYDFTDTSCYKCDPSIGCLLQPKGAACTANEHCEATLHCVGQVCCDSPCDGTCVACIESETGTTTGTCAPALPGRDPLDQCTGDLACDGAGSCFDKAVADSCDADYECVSGHCADGFCCDKACDGLCEACRGDWTGSTNGTCAPITGGTDPDKECIDAATCTGSGTCTGTADIGVPCDHDNQCASNHCADGFCCSSACGICMACAESITGSPNGTCAPVPAPFDPDGDCVASGGFGCNGSGACNPAKTWSTPERIEENSDVATGAKVAVAANGEAMAVWAQAYLAHPNVWANRFVPESGWSTATPLRSHTYNEVLAPDVAMSANGTAVAVWVEHYPPSTVWELWANRYIAGSDWSTVATTAATVDAIDIGTSSQYGLSPRVASDPNGNAMVTWRYTFDPYYHSNNAAAYRFVSDGGWREPKLWSDVGSMHSALDGSGNAIVVWLDHIDGNLLVNRSSSTGTWSGPFNLESSDEAVGGLGSIAMDLDGNAMVVWRQSGASWWNRYTAGVGWGGAIPFPTGIVGESGVADIAAGSTSAIAVWEDDGGWSSQYVHGQGWDTPAQVTENGFSGARVVSDPAGNAVAVWYDTSRDLWANRFVSASSTWGTPEPLGTIDNPATPSVGMDSLGNVVAVWQQGDDIWAATFR